ncbi:hypothetical protein R1flu_022821 [Riccia fluitans]|uniref:Uncharacterized protein n=1 Tax=Riccia fluitans TaxID=41844 RepID=A0ABD1XQS4_9MARC
MPSWLRGSVRDIPNAVGPVIRLPLATKSLSTPSGRSGSLESSKQAIKGGNFGLGVALTKKITTLFQSFLSIWNENPEEGSSSPEQEDIQKGMATRPVTSALKLGEDQDQSEIVGGREVGSSSRYEEQGNFCSEENMIVDPVHRSSIAQQSVSVNRSSYFKADSHLLRKPEVKAELKEVWNQAVCHAASNEFFSPLDRFVSAWRELRNSFKTIQYAEVAKLSRLGELRRELEVLSSSNDPDSMLRIFLLSEEVRCLQAWEDHKWRLWSRDRYLQEGDTLTPYYLERFRAKKTRTPFGPW